MSTTTRTAIVWSDVYREHQTGSHPESPERMVAIGRALRAAGMFDDLLVLDPRPALLEEVLAVHSPELVDLIRQAAHQGGGWLDPDTWVSPTSFDVAMLAAGGALRAVDAVMEGETTRAFALVRPPGHHAEPDEAMGFCLLNNIAIAARHALSAHGLERVAIVDWDVHHGNGTQAAFWREPQVLFISLHQYPFYPGSGSQAEQGEGAGAGATINIPLRAGSDDAVYLSAFEGTVIPALHAFQPQLILVSAGYDAHVSDPLAMMRLQTETFGTFARLLRTAADELCAGRLVLVLEGGYNLTALGASVVETLRGLE
jgi:acetoin utilization deacetylase AcuC-like enzyme